jgi:hypothetical protein
MIWRAGGGTWTRKNDFSPSGSPLDTNGIGQWFERNGKGYILNGENGLKAMWEYTPASDSWQQKAAFPGSGTNRLWPVSWQIKDKGYVVGGWGAAHNGYGNMTWRMTDGPSSQICQTVRQPLIRVHTRGLASGFVMNDASILMEPINVKTDLR